MQFKNQPNEIKIMLIPSKTTEIHTYTYKIHKNIDLYVVYVFVCMYVCTLEYRTANLKIIFFIENQYVCSYETFNAKIMNIRFVYLLLTKFMKFMSVITTMSHERSRVYSYYCLSSDRRAFEFYSRYVHTYIHM